MEVVDININKVRIIFGKKNLKVPFWRRQQWKFDFYTQSDLDLIIYFILLVEINPNGNGEPGPCIRLITSARPYVAYVHYVLYRSPSVTHTILPFYLLLKTGVQTLPLFH